MKAYQLAETKSIKNGSEILQLVDLPIPYPKKDEVLIKISACGICHTEIDEIEGRLTPPVLPIIPGHQVIGRIEKLGQNVDEFTVGQRVGVAWIYSSCESCVFCKKGLPNLCDKFLATGKDRNGGYAEYMIAQKGYIYKIPDFFSDVEAAPLLCAGAIGYRSLKLSHLLDGENLGLTGFGASGHLVLSMAQYLFSKSKIFVFARSEKERHFAKELGAFWVGDTSEKCPEKLHAIIDTTPVWKTVTQALKNLENGGRLVINAIRKEEVDKEELLELSYPDQLWMEKEIKSVANITPSDVIDFLDVAVLMHLKPEIQLYEFNDVNKALTELKEGKIRGAKVLKVV